MAIMILTMLKKIFMKKYGRRKKMVVMVMNMMTLATVTTIRIVMPIVPRMIKMLTKIIDMTRRTIGSSRCS